MYSPSRLALAPGAVEPVLQPGAPLGLEVGHLARDAGHRVHAPDRPMVPGRFEEPRRVLAVRVLVAARQERAGRPLALVGQSLGLAERGLDRPRHALGHRHPPGQRLGVVEREDSVRVVPGRLVVSLLEPEAEILPSLHPADPGERHPQALLGDPALEGLGKEPVILGERRAKPPGRREIEPAESHRGRRFLGRQAKIIGDPEFPGSGVVADPVERGMGHVDPQRQPHSVALHRRPPPAGKSTAGRLSRRETTWHEHTRGPARLRSLGADRQASEGPPPQRVSRTRA